MSEREPRAPSPASLARSDSEARNAYRDYLDAKDERDRAAHRWLEAESRVQQALAKYKQAFEAAYGEQP